MRVAPIREMGCEGLLLGEGSRRWFLFREGVLYGLMQSHGFPLGERRFPDCLAQP
jgi:hypothetical protein